MHKFNLITPAILLVIAFSLGSAPCVAATNHVVTIGGNGFTFSPDPVNIGAGDTVTFENPSGFNHNVVSDPGAVTAFRCANGCDGAGGSGAPSTSQWSATVAFPTPGVIGYFCEIHGGPGVGMHGTINVTVPVEVQSFEID